MKKKNILYIAVAAIGLITACKKNTNGPDLFTLTSNDRLPVIIANTNFTTPTVPTTGFSPGTAVVVELNYVQTDPIKEIQFLQKIGTADSTIINKVAYAPSFSKNKQCDTLLYNYVVPAGQAVGTSITVRGRVVNQNGLFRDRLFTYKTK